MKCLECSVENEDSAKFCGSCGVDLNLKKKSFWKHLFNWKYYIFPLSVGLLIGFDYTQIGENSLSNIKVVGFIMGIIMATQFKASFLKKSLMFFVGGFLTNFLSIAVYFSFIFINDITAKTGVNQQRNKYLDNMMEQNKNLPMMLNEDLQMLKNTTNGQDIFVHIKYINYTKNEILEDYTNVNAFENELLQSELETSCPEKSVKTILQTGIVMKMKYYGENDELIGQIYLNNERCQPYYDNTDIN